MDNPFGIPLTFTPSVQTLRAYVLRSKVINQNRTDKMQIAIS